MNLPKLVEPITDAQISQALVRLRVELFTAAQTLRGDHIVEFWQLIDDINAIRPRVSP